VIVHADETEAAVEAEELVEELVDSGFVR